MGDDRGALWAPPGPAATGRACSPRGATCMISAVDAPSRDFFERLLSAPGVSGYEQPVQSLVREFAGEFADRVTTDLHGNVIAVKNADAAVRIMLAGHADQLGLLVSHIDDEGFLYAQTVGGWDPHQLVGLCVTVWSDAGPVPGVISRKAIHLLNEEERKQVVKPQDLWIDIGATDRDDAASVVRIGDSVTPRLGLQRLRHGLLSAPAMDNRAGLWVVMEALRRAADRGVEAGVFAVSTVQEEIGKRGATTAAFGIDPHVGIAVDVTHATDCPTVDKRERGTIELGGGPVIVRGPNVNPAVEARLRRLAEQVPIPVQTMALGRAAPNDGSALQLTRAGVATGIVQIPNRYMHSAVETVAIDDLDRAAELLARFAYDVDSVEDFVP